MVVTLPNKISFPVNLNLGIANLSVDDITWNLDDSGATSSYNFLLDGKQLDGWPVPTERTSALLRFCYSRPKGS